MRVTIELTDQERHEVSINDRPVAYATSDVSVEAVQSGVDAVTEASDGGAPSDELLEALGIGDQEEQGPDEVAAGDIATDPNPEAAYDSANGTAAGSPPDWLADLLSGKSAD